MFETKKWGINQSNEQTYDTESRGIKLSKRPKNEGMVLVVVLPDKNADLEFSLES